MGQVSPLRKMAQKQNKNTCVIWDNTSQMTQVNTSQMTQVFYSQLRCSWNLRLGIAPSCRYKVENYKQIVPDNYIGRHVISVYDTCTVSRWYDVGKVTALKINTCSSWLFFLSHMWPNSLNHRYFWTNNYIYGSMLYGQPQYSTMTECSQNQWAGKQAPDHCPITVLIASKNGCLQR